MRVTDELSLFRPWPETTGVRGAEQRVFPLRGTIQGRYEAWRQTDDGRLAYALFVRLALTETGRLSAKRIWETCRAQLRVKLNNDFHAPMVREAEDALPELRGRFERRTRKAS